MNARAITIVLADDHTIVRQGLAKLLEAEPNIQVVGEAENGRQAVTKVERLQPDIAIMDIGMPLLNGIEATRQIRKNSPHTKVIILSMHSHDRYISELISLGASGYLLKDSTAKLSNREREVFQMIAEGHPTKEISEILCVSPSTVKTHRANIMEKLQIDNIAHLIQFAIRLGIVEIRSDED
jgi:two-component system response regulator NreC